MIWRRRLVALLLLAAVVGGLVWGVVTAAGTVGDWLGDAAGEEPAEADAPTEEQAPAEEDGASDDQPGPCDPRELDATLEPQGGSGSTEFALSLVNASDAPCLVDVGSASLTMTVHSGEDRVWSSSDCPAGPEERPLLLDRGDGTETTVTWDGHRSQPDCSGDRAATGSGTYRVAVSLDGVELPTAEASFTR